MKYMITYLVLLSAFPTCCNDIPVETGKVPLSESEIGLIPYSLGQTITFQHSNGFGFDFLVTKDEYEWNPDNYCDECCGGEYTSYQRRTVSLNSEYPGFNISLSINSFQYTDTEEKSIDVRINRYSTYLKYDNTSKLICGNVVCHDEISINNTIYHNVMESTLENVYGTNSSIDLYPQKIFYNTDFGIIQVKMSNNETYSLNN